MAHDKCEICARDIKAHDGGDSNLIQIWQFPSYNIKMACEYCAEQNKKREENDEN
ncbi:hypothetical protein OAF54_03220 [bacterium]|nr:hypothetical protein [bacterium]